LRHGITCQHDAGRPALDLARVCGEKVAPVKLYSTLERRVSMLPASACPPPVSARRVSALRVTPPILAAQWVESAQTPVVVPAVALATDLVPSARVAVEAIEAAGVARTDLFHVASAAQLDQRPTSVQGITGSAKHDMTAPKPNGGVRGIPPRGRPV
jgi:hypothetical protein